MGRVGVFLKENLHRKMRCVWRALTLSVDKGFL